MEKMAEFLDLVRINAQGVRHEVIVLEHKLWYTVIALKC